MITKLYYTTNEVAKISEIRPSTITFWETKFGKLHSISRKIEMGFGKEKRIFTPLDVQRIKTIKALLGVKGFSIKGAIRELKELDFLLNKQ